MKKILSALLTVLMVFAFETDAWAGAEGGSGGGSRRSSSSRSRRQRQPRRNNQDRSSQQPREDSARQMLREGNFPEREGEREEAMGEEAGPDAENPEETTPEEKVVETPNDKLWKGISEKSFMLVSQAIDAGAYVNMEKDDVFVLAHAMNMGDETNVLFLMEKGADPSLLDKQGRNMLYTAFEKMNNENVISTFLHKGASVNQKDFSGVPLFFYAFSVSRKDEILSLIADMGKADFNLTSEAGDSILTYLIKNRLPARFIDFVLTKKPNVNLQDAAGDTPLMLALRNGDSQLVEKLVNAGADVNIANKAGVTSLNYALVSVKDPVLLEKLITRKVNVNMQDKQGNTPLMFVLKTSRDPTAVELLIDAGADLNIKDNKGDTPLMYVARMMKDKDFLDSDYFMELLLDFGAQVNDRDAQGKTPLMNLILSKRVSVMDDVKLVQMFIKHEADLDMEDFEGNTALLIAVRDTASAPLVKTLIMGGANVKKMDASSKTPLDYAQNNLRLSLKEGYDEILRKLTTNTENQRVRFFKFLKIGNLSDVQDFLAQGADINGVDDTGDTPLMKVVMYKRPLEIIEYLLKNGADINAANKDGDTALMKAVMLKDAPEIVNLLIASGAQVNARNKKGDTVLRRAVWYSDSAAVVEALIKAGADVNADDTQGQTIWDYAEKSPEIKEKETYVKLLELTE